MPQWWKCMFGSKQSPSFHRPPAPPRLEPPPEAQWLEQARQDSIQGWEYDKSCLRPGGQATLVWHEYPLACIWVMPTEGTFASERSPSVCAEQAPIINCLGQRSVGAALRHAARRIVDCAEDADRDYFALLQHMPAPGPEWTAHWRRMAAALLTRAERGDLDQLPL